MPRSSRVDKNNPSLLNEYGDVCLKAGEVPKALRQFLAAASKYRSNGLLNNAQAVYKKVLRHDANNLNANWFLAEIRATQDLLADGEQHALRFLSAAESVSRGDQGGLPRALPGTHGSLPGERSHPRPAQRHLPPVGHAVRGGPIELLVGLPRASAGRRG